MKGSVAHKSIWVFEKSMTPGVYSVVEVRMMDPPVKAFLAKVREAV